MDRWTISSRGKKRMRSALTFQSSPFKGFPVTVRWIRGFNRTTPSERSQRGPKRGRARLTFQQTTCCFLAMTALVYRFLHGKPGGARASSGHESPRARDILLQFLPYPTTLIV